MKVNRIRFTIWVDLSSEDFTRLIERGYHITYARCQITTGDIHVEVKLVKYVYVNDEEDRCLSEVRLSG